MDLIWVTNDSSERFVWGPTAGHEVRRSQFIVGAPKATSEFTSHQLSTMGLVGLYRRADVGLEEAAKIVHKSQLPEAADGLWYPPQQEGFGPWVEHDGSEGRPAGISNESIVARLFRSERNRRQYEHDPKEGEYFRNWSGTAAYCVKLDAPVAAMQTAQATDPGWHDWHEGDSVPFVDRVDVIRTDVGVKGAAEKQIDNVVTTSQYWGPGSFVRKWRPAVPKAPQHPNAGMIKRDTDGVVSCVREQHQLSTPMTLEEIKSLGRALARQWTDRAVSEAAWVERDPFARRLGLGH